MEYYDYDQDPSPAYGYNEYGYDEYGYSGYGNEPVSQGPPPPPDKNWEDPLKTNTEYIRLLQRNKNNVHEGFETLKQENLFLLEVQVESFSLKQELLENEATNDDKSTFHITQMQFWKLPFTEVNGIGEVYDRENESRMSLANDPNYSLLFQNINSFTIEEQNDLDDKRDQKDFSLASVNETSSLYLGEDEKQIVENESQDQSEDEEESGLDKHVVMKGVSAIFGMTGFKMIQTLQKSPVKIRVVQVKLLVEEDKVPVEENRDIDDEAAASSEQSLNEVNESNYKESLIPKNERVETVLGEASIRIPEVLREAVLKGNSASDSGTYKLIDPDGELVGKVQVTIVIKCYGKAVLNCMSRYGYGDTMILVCEPCDKNEVIKETFVPELDDVLLRIFESKMKSSQMLRKCLELSNKGKCGWYEMAQQCLPLCPIPETTSLEQLEKLEMERELAWREVKHICRQLKTEVPKKNSLYDRLESLRVTIEDDEEIQTGVAILDVNNPFEEEAFKSSITSKSDSVSKRRRSTKTSGRSSQRTASKGVSNKS